MTEQLRQSLSAVVDGEADAFELRRVLDELDRDPALRAAWTRYHLIGSVIRGEHEALVARAQEPAPVTWSDARADSGLSVRPILSERAARVTVATALVAALALVSGLFLIGSEAPETEIAAAPEGAKIRQNSSIIGLPTAAEPLSPVAADEQWVQAYMLQHAEQQGLNQRGIISLVRPATYSVP